MGLVVAAGLCPQVCARRSVPAPAARPRSAPAGQLWPFGAAQNIPCSPVSMFCTCSSAGSPGSGHGLRSWCCRLAWDGDLQCGENWGLIPESLQPPLESSSLFPRAAQPWTPAELQRLLDPSPMCPSLRSGEGSAGVYEHSIFYTNKCFLFAARRCGKPGLCTPAKQSTTRSSPSRPAPCSRTVSPGAAPEPSGRTRARFSARCLGCGSQGSAMSEDSEKDTQLLFTLVLSFANCRFSSCVPGNDLNPRFMSFLAVLFNVRPISTSRNPMKEESRNTGITGINSKVYLAFSYPCWKQLIIQPCLGSVGNLPFQVPDSFHPKGFD